MRPIAPKGSRGGAPPRVLHVVESWRPLPSGYASRSWWIVTGQARLGIARPGVLVTSRQSVYADEAPTGAPGVDVTASAPSPLELRRRRRNPFYVDKRHLRDAIVATARASDAQIVHVHWSSAIGAAAAAAAREVGARLVTEVRFDLAGAMNAQSFGGRGRVLEPVLRRWFERHLKRADARTAASEALAGLLRRRGHDVTAVPNGVDAGFLAACDAARAAAASAGSRGPDARLTLGTTAKMLRYENLGAILGVLRAVPRADAVFVGDGPERARLEAEAAGFAPGRVTFTGRVPAERIPAALASMDLFVVPRLDRTVTRYAGPIKVVEAMAAGCCVLGSAVGETAALLADGRGVLVPPGRPDALVDAVRRLADDADARDRCGAAARSWAASELAGDALLRRYDSVYGAALGRTTGEA